MSATSTTAEQRAAVVYSSVIISCTVATSSHISPSKLSLNHAAVTLFIVATLTGWQKEGHDFRLGECLCVSYRTSLKQ
ncbi:hypothetical protein ARMSODRAFT_966291 [Armillaria solidipes]|uniref:Uncharacterized protein n=1 Tax=Armillaria solidipes TaxID=1076256 RepID=A0A2H3B297_9AGAR|nr:hypothetical protein ARMSODRAFT_966291 [Armillaria solidipes]